MNKYVTLSEAADAGMKSGDLLLYQAGRSLADLLISRAGRTRYCHAGRAWVALPGLVAQHWRTLDTTARYGGRYADLAVEVAHHPRRIDVFGPNLAVARALGAAYNPEKAVEWLLKHVVGRPYGWWSILRASCLHLPFIRLCIRPQTDDKAINHGLLPFCSHAQAMADREAGIDPVVNLADRLVEPGDLARSLFWGHGYRFTLDAEGAT